MQTAKQSSTTLPERINEILSCQSRIISLEKESGDVRSRINQINRTLPHIRHHLGSLQGTVKRDHEKGRNPSPYETAMKKKEAELNSVLNDEKVLTERLSSLDKDKNNEESFLKLLNEGANAEEALQHVHQLSEAKNQVERIANLIKEQNELLASISCDNDEELERLQVKREEILADIALGKKKQKELDKIDDEINALVKDADGNHADSINQFRQVKQTISGLESRLKKAEAILQELSSLTPHVAEQYLVKLINQAGSEYIKHAQGLIGAFRLIKAYSDLISRVTGSNVEIVNPAHLENTSLPAFDIACFEGAEKEGGLLFYGHSQAQRELYNDIKQAELSRFKEMGLGDLFG